MAKYYILSNGQKYKVSMSDVTDYTTMDSLPTEDIIHYTVNLDEGEWEGTISAWIENPSQHTLYLIEQGRCFITVNVRGFHTRSPYRYGIAGEWDPNDPLKINPSWELKAHSSGLGRGAYRFHKQWSICQADNNSYALSVPVQVQDVNNIELPIQYRESWDGRYYDLANTRGYMQMEYNSNQYENPYRNSFYFDIRLALLSSINSNRYYNTRVYQTKSRITRITFER